MSCLYWFDIHSYHFCLSDFILICSHTLKCRWSRTLTFCFIHNSFASTAHADTGWYIFSSHIWHSLHFQFLFWILIWYNLQFVTSNFVLVLLIFSFCFQMPFDSHRKGPSSLVIYLYFCYALPALLCFQIFSSVLCCMPSFFCHSLRLFGLINFSKLFCYLIVDFVIGWLLSWLWTILTFCILCSNVPQYWLSLLRMSLQSVTSSFLFPFYKYLTYGRFRMMRFWTKTVLILEGRMLRLPQFVYGIQLWLQNHF